MISAIITCILLVSTPGYDFEQQGMLIEAGAAYQDEGLLADQSRILCSFLEDALYAGDANRALDIIRLFKQYPIDLRLLSFWYGRLAWQTGLSDTACELLQTVDGDDWLSFRARGIQMTYRNSPAEAVEYLSEAVTLATSSRELYYASVDLCFALIQSGSYIGSELISRHLVLVYPNDGLAPVVLALSLLQQSKFAEAMNLLQATADNDIFEAGSRLMAASLLLEFE